METAPCPDCDYELSVPRPREGQRVTCPNCGTELEVIAVNPLELDWAYSEPEEDWADLDEDDWDEDEDWEEEEDLGEEQEDWEEP